MVSLSRYRLLILLVLLSTAKLAQGQSCWSIVPQFEGQTLVLQQPYPLNEDGDSLSIDKLRFYLSEVDFYFHHELVHQPKQRHFLLDLEKPASLQLPCVPADLAYDEIRFTVGIDSLTNVSGAMGGDLDPMHGMYWAWQSGYINFKLEGTSSLCPTRRNQFQFHLGGYLPPHAASRPVVVQVPTHENGRIGLDLAPFLQSVVWSDTHTVMRPGAEAAKLSDKLSTLFQLAP